MGKPVVHWEFWSKDPAKVFGLLREGLRLEDPVMNSKNRKREVVMLGDKDGIATIAVKDIDVARKFYEEKLGLKEEPSEEPGVITCKSGNSLILIYESKYAGTNKATAVTWAVGDVQREVQALKSKGIAFEHYDFPDTKLEGDVHVSGNTKAAWFKDPDGNILALVNQ